jgi:hypothetical protein
MKYKRSFIFTRPNSGTEFYSVTTNFIDQLRAVIPNHINITSGYQDKDSEYVSFWFPEFEDYHWFTQNLYIKGELKQVFRNAMIYAKTNRLAFCLPSVNLQNIPANKITRWWYCNVKAPEEKLYDTTPAQKQALELLNCFMSMPDSVHSVTIFDFDHNVKFTESAVKSNVNPNQLRRRLLNIERDAFKEFRSTKDSFNQEHNVNSFTDIDCISRIGSDFDLTVIKDVVPIEMQNLVFNLEI